LEDKKDRGKTLDKWEREAQIEKIGKIRVKQRPRKITRRRQGSGGCDRVVMLREGDRHSMAGEGEARNYEEKKRSQRELDEKKTEDGGREQKAAEAAAGRAFRSRSQKEHRSNARSESTNKKQKKRKREKVWGKEGRPNWEKRKGEPQRSR